MGRNLPHAQGAPLGGFVQEMIKGANVALPDLSDSVGSVIVSLGWASPTGEGDADVSVLLLDSSGKVRSDSDFYFYNHPVAADGSVQVLGKTPTADGSEDRISFDLTAVPAEIDRIVVAASRYDGARFGELKGTLTYSERRAARYSPIIQSMPHSSQPNTHMPAPPENGAPAVEE
ncbi:hypothetical protein SGLAM104S_00007 [Streptomyces glaucescens]